MAALSIKEGMKAYVEDQEREINDGWGKRLSDDKCQHLKDSLAAFVEEQCAFLEKAWNPENPDRLETQMNELVDDLVKEVKSQAAESGNADGFDENELLDRITITVEDGPDDIPGSYTLTAEVEEKSPSDNKDAHLEFTVSTSNGDYQVIYPYPESDGDEVDDDDIWREKEIGSGAYDDLTRDGPVLEDDQSGGLPAMHEEEMDDNIVARFEPASQQGANSGVADSPDAADAGDSSPLSSLGDWEHGLGEDVMDSIEVDASVTNTNDVNEDAPSENSDIASQAGPSDHQEKGEIHKDSRPDASSSDELHSEAFFEPMDVDDDDDDDDDEDSDPADDPKGKQPQKAKAKAKAPAEHHRHKNNDLWDVVVDAKKPHGPPAGYICKLAGCDRWQGRWKGRQTHFEAKHPEEWFNLTGRRMKVYTCPVDGCGWTTNGMSYLRNHKRAMHGMRVA